MADLITLAINVISRMCVSARMIASTETVELRFSRLLFSREERTQADVELLRFIDDFVELISLIFS